MKSFNSDELSSMFKDKAHSPSLKSLQKILSKKSEITDFSIPVNLGFPTADFKTELSNNLENIIKYYPSEPKDIAKKVSSIFSLKENSVIVGNGSTELFYFILNMKKRRILTPTPTFGRWTDAPMAQGHFLFCLPRKEHNNFSLNFDHLIKEVEINKIDTVIISNPNNPTGAINSKEELKSLINKLKNIELIIIDESFLDFNPNSEKISLLHDVDEFSNVVVLKSLGKSLGLHGIRLGMMVGSSSFISSYLNYIPFWNINGLAENVIDLLPKYLPSLKKGLIETIKKTNEMEIELRSIPNLKVFPCNTNFCFVRTSDHIDPIKFRNYLLIKHGLFIRSCGNKIDSDASFFRVSVRDIIDVNRLSRAISSYKE